MNQEKVGGFCWHSHEVVSDFLIRSKVRICNFYRPF